MEKIAVGVIGATGMVGQNYIRLLNNHPWFEVTYVGASPGSAGKRYKDAVAGRWHMQTETPDKAGALVVADANQISEAKGRCDLLFSALEMDKKAVAELVVKAYGKGSDDIKVWEKIHLNGTGARGMAKSRLVLGDKAKAEVRGETYGNAPYARGHVDCMELVNGTEAVARAIPIVSVTDGKAKVTHEAAIGSIDRKQVETLMARGLDENEAVDVIVRGILR